MPPRKVILLGSGGLSIGQAGEFDYSGTQAAKSIREENIEVLIVNPNIATVQTNPDPSGKIFLYPVEPSWVEKIIQKEKPDGLIAGFGGQTALNCAMKLDELGVLKKYGVTNLGTPIETLRVTEDRKLFAEKMRSIGMPIPSSEAVSSAEEAYQVADRIGYPLIVRAAFALGGLGSGFANNKAELQELLEKAFSLSPQFLLEKSLKGWKELEYEVMRDSAGNTITICNMENLDPLGIHTGDSIVVAPSQTLSDDEYQMLRDAAIKIVHSLGVVGECNVQFALDPKSLDFYVIEVNARLSRSSALASKASGYPIAFIAAKLVLGYDLPQLKNPVTGITTAFYEPALDYVTVKIPRWDMTKFRGASRRLGSAMKSVGEIMAIGRNFPEALQKAVRMVSENPMGLSAETPQKATAELQEALAHPTDQRIFDLVSAFRSGIKWQRIHELTQMDPWFLTQIQSIIRLESEIKQLSQKSKSSLSGVDSETWREWKTSGFGDEQIAELWFKPKRRKELQTRSLEIRKARKAKGITPVVKKIDTTAAEYPSPSNYLYMSYCGSVNDPLPKRGKIKTAIVLGGGPYRIGSSVEFDWCAVSCAAELKKASWRSVIINCNPETVSTDFSCSDHLYFDELSLERILDIAEHEEAHGIIVSMGGQLPNCLALPLSEAESLILGHPPEAIDQAEDRAKFSALLDQLKIEQPDWISATSRKEVDRFIDKTGFPVLVRPSYVLSGAAMNVAWDKESLDRYLGVAEEASTDHPIVISKFIEGAKEVEMDGVARSGEILAAILNEHVEYAGIHSGDATLSIPTRGLSETEIQELEKRTEAIARKLKLNGPFNIQFLVRDGEIKIIECNARSSRSFPFVSKVSGINLARLATEVMIEQVGVAKLRSVAASPWLHRIPIRYFGVKAPMFSFNRVDGVDPVVGVEMLSTGEVGCMAKDFDEAFLLALQSSGVRIPKKGVLVSAGPKSEKAKFLSLFSTLEQMKIPVFATDGTAKYLAEHGKTAQKIAWPSEDERDVIRAIREGWVDLVINIPKSLDKEELTHSAEIRKAAVRHGCSLLTDMEKVTAFLSAISRHPQLLAEHQPIHLPAYRY